MAAYFEGWYVKQQTDDEVIAFIPALHTAPNGQRTASLQIATPGASYSVSYPSMEIEPGRRALRIGESLFSPSGCTLDVRSGGVTLAGKLTFSQVRPPRYDIMGPFRFAPLMQCRHCVISMAHRVDGELTLNGRQYRFHSAHGYIEGDRGVSFPSRYVWTQCCFDGGSVMLSVADIPYLGLHFKGCIAFVYLNGKEYRLATYLGARVEAVDNRAVVIRQGRLCLTARLLHAQAAPLQAPSAGIMQRTIHESARCTVAYRFTDAAHERFSLLSEQASFEGAWD